MNHLRTSERNLFKRCQWAWERNYQDNLKTGREESVALWFGTGIHLALEKWYVPGTVRGVDPRETWKKYVDDSRGDTEYVNTVHDGDFSEAVSARELGIDMLTQYLDHYGLEPHLEVLSVEQTFQIPIKHQEWFSTQCDSSSGPVASYHRGPSETTYVGTFDIVIRDHNQGGKVLMWDHKTTKALGSQNTQYLPLDDQAGTYWSLATYTLRKQGVIGQDEVLAGMLYNYLAKSKADTRPKNEQGYATNKPIKKHYVSALSAIGIEEHEGKPLDKATLAKLELLADEHKVTVYGEVSASQPKKNLDRVQVYRHRSQQRSQVERIQNDLEAMSLVKNGLLKATKTPTRECGFCEFRELCELDESGKDWTEMAEMMYTKWDPYSAHREKN
ncbi:MAG: PD-(D/E)XK nuclease family protein [Alphaproteobacteria bacterium]|nr:PD-(D/E)XK nuclease family protein [Alphaproteobacteria bacterium]